MSDQDELVDVLVPPMFKPTGEVKTRAQAHKDGNWIGTFNLWIVTNNPAPSIIYQQRSPEKKWAPGLLDVAAGGHYMAGERLAGGLREVEEELGKHYLPDEIVYLGRKLYVGYNSDGTPLNNVVEIYIVEDDLSLQSYKLQKEELYALCKCPLGELLKAHRDDHHSFRVTGLDANGAELKLEINKASFPANYDNYHYKMAVLAERYFRGEKDLLY